VLYEHHTSVTALRMRVCQTDLLP